MVITKSTPFTRDEIEKLRERFEVYIKTVIDIERKICSAGCDRHYESEQFLLQEGSNQQYLWGGGLDLETQSIDCNSFINIRPADGNLSNEILIDSVRVKFHKQMKYFFAEVV